MKECCLPPKVQDILSALLNDRAKNVATGKARAVRDAHNGWASISSTRSPQLFHQVGSTILSCTCGELKLTTHPCQHELEKQIVTGTPAASLFAPKDSLATWKAQYLNLEVQPFFENAMYSYRLGLHVVPVALKNPRGRPKIHRCHKSKLEKTKSKKTKAKKQKK